VMAGTLAHTERKCPNPGCFARGGDNPPYPADRAQGELDYRERCAAIERERERTQQSALRQAATSRMEAETRLVWIRDEAQRRGACVPCALRSGPVFSAR
jgi:hypothetical protein